MKNKIRVETNFKRTIESTIVLGLASSNKYISLEESFNKKSCFQQYQFAANKIQDFIKKNGRKIPIFGEITGFWYIDNKGDKISLKIDLFKA